jgi:protoporphyrinogen oxidase
MEHHRFVVIGAGISGISFAQFVEDDDVLLIEKEDEIGGYCRTVKKDGFVWDYSGHFFHFKEPELEKFLVDRMPDQQIRVVEKQSRILFEDREVDFPFQKNIHQLPQEEFVECLYDLYFKDEEFGSDEPATNFKELLYRKFGRGITDRFLIPYNEKLYACSLDELDVDAMGRFFPWADVDDIIRNFRRPDNASYNATFTYPEGGAIQYVEAMKKGVSDDKFSLNETVLAVDLDSKTVTTDRRTVSFDHLISSAPFDRLLDLCGVTPPEDMLRYNKVLVFNLGFNKSGKRGIHWMYIPETDYRFYRVGFYSNIFDTERLSLYVEIGFPSDAEIDIDSERGKVLKDLKKAGIIDDHEVASEHNVILDPAYVHITNESTDYVNETRDALATRGVHPIGRYGGWTYCSIEDNMIEARDLAERFNRVDSWRSS